MWEAQTNAGVASSPRWYRHDDRVNSCLWTAQTLCVSLQNLPIKLVNVLNLLITDRRLRHHGNPSVFVNSYRRRPASFLPEGVVLTSLLCILTRYHLATYFYVKMKWVSLKLQGLNLQWFARQKLCEFWMNGAACIATACIACACYGTMNYAYTVPWSCWS